MWRRYLSTAVRDARWKNYQTALSAARLTPQMAAQVAPAKNIQQAAAEILFTKESLDSASLRKYWDERLSDLEEREVVELYSTVMGGLILYDRSSDNILAFHKLFKYDTIKDAVPGLLKLATMRSNNMLEFFDQLEQKQMDGMFDDLILHWTMTQAEDVGDLLDRLISNGNFPASRAAFDALAYISNANLAQSVIQAARRGHKVPARMFQLALRNLRPTARRQQKSALRAFMKLRPEYRTDEFWQAAFRHLRRIPPTDMMLAIDNVGPRALREYALRQKTVAGCQQAIEKYKARNWPVPASVYGHLVHLQALVDGQSNNKRTQPQAAMLYETMMEHIQNDEFLINGHAYGLFLAGNYKAIRKFHDRVVKLGKATTTTWNLALQSHCRRRDMRLGNVHLLAMIERGVKLRNESISECIMAYLCYGRSLAKARTKHLSRGPVINGLVQSPEPFSMEYICSILDKLSELGYELPQSRMSRLVMRLGTLQAITFKDAETFIMKIAQLHVTNLPSTRTRRQPSIIEQSIMELEKDESSQAKHVKSNLLSEQAIKAIVQLGFFKKPRKPWCAAELLKNVRQLGVPVPQHEVVKAYTELFRVVYGHACVRSEYKRVRLQVNSQMTIEQVIERVNQAWAD